MNTHAIKKQDGSVDEGHDKRQLSDTESLILIQLDPMEIIDGVQTDDGYLTDDINTFGEMREKCPACTDVHLKLVLRQKRVRRSHMFCDHCTRCFDAYYPNGVSALSII